MATRVPHPSLRPHVLELSGFEELRPGFEHRPLHRYPLPFAHLVIEFGAPSRLVVGGDQRTARTRAGGYLAGPGAEFMLVEATGHQRLLLVHLSCTAARRLIGMPMSELEDGLLHLQDLPYAEGRSLADQLRDAPDWEARFDLVEDVLARRILGSRLDTCVVEHAVSRIHNGRGELSMATLAKDLGCSHKHLIALFRDQVGVRPKLFARLERFHHLMRRFAAGGSPNLAELASAHGYSDQAHLAREMKQLTGLTPRLTRASLVGSGFLIR